MIYNFDTDDHNSATAALIVYAIYRSRDKRRFKVSPEMWGQIERAVKAAAKRDLQDWYESTKAELEKARARVAELATKASEPYVLRKQAEALEAMAEKIRNDTRGTNTLWEMLIVMDVEAQELCKKAEAAERAREDGGNG